MPKFFQVEKAAYGGEKNTFSNVNFKKNGLENSSAAEAGTILVSDLQKRAIDDLYCRFPNV